MLEREEKKKWSTPQLIVLVQEKLEEGVLAVCKSMGPIPGPVGYNIVCAQPKTQACSIYTNS